MDGCFIFHSSVSAVELMGEDRLEYKGNIFPEGAFLSKIFSGWDLNSISTSTGMFAGAVSNRKNILWFFCGTEQFFQGDTTPAAFPTCANGYFIGLNQMAIVRNRFKKSYSEYPQKRLLTSSETVVLSRSQPTAINVASA